jgi:hypothetical protein
MSKLIDHSRNTFPAEDKDGDLRVGAFWGVLLSIPLWGVIAGIVWLVAA